MLTHFWRIWSKDYLQQLAPERIWRAQEKRLREVAVDDVVLIAEDNMVRNEWLLARVSKLLPGPDGHTRSVELTLPSGKTLHRPVKKIALLEGAA